MLTVFLKDNNTPVCAVMDYGLRLTTTGIFDGAGQESVNIES